MQIWMHHGWRCVTVYTQVPCKNLQNLASDANQLYVLLYTTLVGFLIGMRAVGKWKSGERCIDETVAVRGYVNPCMIGQRQSYAGILMVKIVKKRNYKARGQVY
jgi:hypothetical protein